mmetsp:Transcript_15801/g.55017  ORF Transcript_15801/g.55017 Transcript_15801/m.55017 type:complete len:278 (-) Transcript_15801:137-970(-)
MRAQGEHAQIRGLAELLCKPRAAGGLGQRGPGGGHRRGDFAEPAGDAELHPQGDGQLDAGSRMLDPRCQWDRLLAGVRVQEPGCRAERLHLAQGVPQPEQVPLGEILHSPIIYREGVRPAAGRGAPGGGAGDGAAGLGGPGATRRSLQRVAALPRHEARGCPRHLQRQLPAHARGFGRDVEGRGRRAGRAAVWPRRLLCGEEHEGRRIRGALLGCRVASRGERHAGSPLRRRPHQRGDDQRHRAGELAEDDIRRPQPLGAWGPRVLLAEAVPRGCDL